MKPCCFEIQYFCNKVLSLIYNHSNKQLQKRLYIGNCKTLYTVCNVACSLVATDSSNVLPLDETTHHWFKRFNETFESQHKEVFYCLDMCHSTN